MKVLFAVSNENISTQIVKKYQKEYKEIISYKNMYYFNAIVKELQRDKSYDRVVISEDLEPFANNNYDAIEKFLFEKLDNISDEATGNNGKEIPIILLASDKRTKSEQLLVKLFGIGIYNVLLGQDRSTDNVCALLNKPRNKKEAKLYYKIEADEVSYKSESEDNVSEIEIKNILNHYRKLGKDEERYVESFNNIAAQYNDAQLRIITKFLPLNVKAVLEEKSPKYQSVMTFANTASTSELMKKKKEEEGLKIGFLNYSNSKKPTEPVIVPTALNKTAMKKSMDIESQEDTKDLLPGFEGIDDFKQDDNLQEQEVEENVEQVKEKPEVEIKRGRGRPKKEVTEKINVVKRGRGRPRKEVSTSKEIIPGFDEVEEEKLPGFDEVEEEKLPGFDEVEEEKLPGFDEVEEKLPGFDEVEEKILPGFDEVEEEKLPGFDEVEEEKLPGFDEVEEEKLPGFDEVEEKILPGFDEVEEEKLSGFDEVEEEKLPGFDEVKETLTDFHRIKDERVEKNINLLENDFIQENNNSHLVLNDKKIVSFIGASKNGTSFLVNNIAKILSSMGIKTAILDLTTNRNSYYIYTKNEENLRNIASESIKKLRRGITEGIAVEKNLEVYTGLPGDILPLEDVKEIIETLEKRYSIILIDCDFTTPVEYFKIAQEVYIVQTMDILTIQPMTLFLRDIKAKGILDASKLRVIINKEMKVKDLTPKVIMGGLSKYNDPSMTFMTDVFNVKEVKYYVLPFDEKVCSKYLESIVDCEIKLGGYPNVFTKKLKEIANVVYPVLNQKNKKMNEYSSEQKFSNEMNDTLEQMKKRY